MTQLGSGFGDNYGGPDVVTMLNSLVGAITVAAGSGIEVNSSGSTITIAATSSGAGTVTSVALSLPNIFSVTGSPVTESGTLAASLVNQNANIVFAGPSSGGAATPSFRSLVAGDIPSLAATYALLASTTDTSFNFGSGTAISGSQAFDLTVSSAGTKPRLRYLSTGTGTGKWQLSNDGSTFVDMVTSAITGSGTTSTLAVFTGSGAIGNSNITQSSTNYNTYSSVTSGGSGNAGHYFTNTQITANHTIAVFSTGSSNNANGRIGIRIGETGLGSSVNGTYIDWQNGGDFTTYFRMIYSPTAARFVFDGINNLQTSFRYNSTERLGITSTGVAVNSGTTLVRLLSASATLDFPDLSTEAYSDLTITVTGAAVGDTVILGLPTNAMPGTASVLCNFTAWVSATNTVTVRAENPSTSTAYNPPSGTYRVAVLGF